ncbi:MAG: hypothetical protein KDA42_01120 [Planctomycetales bacterium]|nr:hypothetical protein [Planctomycetales bacterium]
MKGERMTKRLLQSVVMIVLGVVIATPLNAAEKKCKGCGEGQGDQQSKKLLIEPCDCADHELATYPNGTLYYGDHYETCSTSPTTTYLFGDLGLYEDCGVPPCVAGKMKGPKTTFPGLPDYVRDEYRAPEHPGTFRSPYARRAFVWCKVNGETNPRYFTLLEHKGQKPGGQPRWSFIGFEVDGTRFGAEVSDPKKISEDQPYIQHGKISNGHKEYDVVLILKGNAE